MNDHLASQPWYQGALPLDYHHQDFIAVPNSCLDAPYDSAAKLMDAPSLLVPRTPPQQVPELALEINWAYLPQVPGDQMPQVPYDQVLKDLLQGSQPLQETQVLQQVPQGLQQETPEGPSLPHLPPEALQEVPLISPGTSAGGAAHTPPSPPHQAGGRKARRAPRVKRTKLYEQTEKFDDPVKEKRRLDAINSKKNRDLKKATLAELRRQVEEYMVQRDQLQQEVEALKQREAELTQQLQARHALPPFSLTPPLSHLSLTSSPPPHPPSLLQ